MKADEISAALSARKLDVLRHLFPEGEIESNEFYIGSLAGERGRSLKIHLGETKGPIWSDFAVGDKGGDLLDLWAAARCDGDLKLAMREAARWLGLSDAGFGPS